QAVYQWMEAHPNPLILIDGWSAFFPGDNENDASQTRKFILVLRDLTKRGATVIVLHHPGKAETAKVFRGSSYFSGGIDCGWTVKNSGADRLATVRLTAFKNRLAPRCDFAFKFVEGKGFISESGQPMRGGQNEIELFVELLKANPGVNTSTFERLAQENDL